MSFIESNIFIKIVFYKRRIVSTVLCVQILLDLTLSLYNWVIKFFIKIVLNVICVPLIFTMKKNIILILYSKISFALHAIKLQLISLLHQMESNYQLGRGIVMGVRMKKRIQNIKHNI